MVKITQAPNGAARREVELDRVKVPDLWHLAMYLKDNEATIAKAVGHNHLVGQSWSDAVLETWHLCHDLLENIRNPELVKRDWS